MPEIPDRSLTLKIPDDVHKKLKVIAALQNSTLSGAIVYLVRKETFATMEQTDVMKSLLKRE